MLSPKGERWTLGQFLPSNNFSGSTRLSRYISSIDTRYGALFGDILWKENVEKLSETSTANPPDQQLEFLDIAAKLREYICEASQVLHLAIAEAMFTFRQRRYRCR